MRRSLSAPCAYQGKGGCARDGRVQAQGAPGLTPPGSRAVGHKSLPSKSMPTLADEGANPGVSFLAGLFINPLDMANGQIYRTLSSQQPQDRHPTKTQCRRQLPAYRCPCLAVPLTLATFTESVFTMRLAGQAWVADLAHRLQGACQGQRPRVAGPGVTPVQTSSLIQDMPWLTAGAYRATCPGLHCQKALGPLLPLPVPS